MIEAFDCLTKGALSQKFLHLKPIGNVVTKDNLVIATFIIIAKIIRVKRRAFDLLGSNAQEVNLLIV